MLVLPVSYAVRSFGLAITMCWGGGVHPELITADLYRLIKSMQLPSQIEVPVPVPSLSLFPPSTVDLDIVTNGRIFYDG